MILSELKTAIADWTHRTDLEPHMGTFVNNVSSRLGRRFGVMPALLIAADDTNAFLDLHSNVYLYGCLREAAIHTHNLDATQAYEALYQKEITEMNINYRGCDWDKYPSPVMAKAGCV